MYTKFKNLKPLLKGKVEASYTLNYIFKLLNTIIKYYFLKVSLLSMSLIFTI